MATPPPPDPALSMSAARLAEHLPVGVVVVVPRGLPLFANEVAAELLGTDVATLCAEPLADAMAPVDRRTVEDTVAQLALAAGHEMCALAASNGRPIEASFVSRIEQGGREVEVVVVTIQDVTPRLEREQLLEHRANHDVLTGLANRAWLLDHLHERLQRRDELVAAFVDLDRFKAVNDRLGHVVGDAVLASVAEGLEACLHRGEHVARVGGDEFVVVAPPMDDGALADLSQRIRLAVATVRVARQEHVGASVGMARSMVGDQPWDLLGRADEAMYAEKTRTGVRPVRSVPRRMPPAEPPGDVAGSDPDARHS